MTRVGPLELRVPQDRDGHFSTSVFERYQRSEKALVAALAEMYVEGVSTRKVKRITEELCGHSFQASTISNIVKRLDGQLAGFSERRLEEPFPYLILDARYERVRDSGVIASRAVLIALGVDWDGRRQVLAVELDNRESRSSWKDFLLALRARGLDGVEFVVSDDHAGLRQAITEVLPQAAMLRAFPQERAGPHAAQVRRRLPAGAALALRPAQSRGGAYRPRSVAGTLAKPLSEADGLG